MRAIGKDHDIIKTLRKNKKQGGSPNLLVSDELGVLEKYIGSKQQGRFSLEVLVICAELLTSDYAKTIRDALEPLASDVFSVSEKTYALIAEKKNSGGLMGVFAYREDSPEAFFACDYSRLIVMDGLENPGNVGTILRSADAAGFDAVLAVDLKTHINGNKCVQASRGMVFELPILSTDCKTAMDWLARIGFTSYLGEPEAGQSYEKIKYAEKCALVVGSERFGVNPAWFTASHERIYIPMTGSMTSLNVGVAASLLMYEVFRQKG